MPCEDENKVIYNIKELPEVFNVEQVDLFVVETLNGTSVVSFDNIVIDLEQTTFEEEFNQHTTDILELSGKLGDVVDDVETLNDTIDALLATIVDAIYPIGAIYMTTTNTNPGTFLTGTTWTRVANGKFVAGVGSGTDGNGESVELSEGDDQSLGEYNHTLTEDELAAHTHGTGHWNDKEQTHIYGTKTAPVGEFSIREGDTNGDRQAITETIGGDTGHNNIPPYFGVYVWKRDS